MSGKESGEGPEGGTQPSPRKCLTFVNGTDAFSNALCWIFLHCFDLKRS